MLTSVETRGINTCPLPGPVGLFITVFTTSRQTSRFRQVRHSRARDLRRRGQPRMLSRVVEESCVLSPLSAYLFAGSLSSVSSGVLPGRLSGFS